MAPGWVAGSGWPSPAIVALNSAFFEDNAKATGDLSVITASPGPVLSGNYEAVVGIDVELRGNLSADSVLIRDGGHVFGTAAYNGVTNRGVIDGAVTSPLGLPLPITVPTVPDFSAGTQTIDLAASQTQRLASGSYGSVTLRAGTAASKTILTLSGGVYNMLSLALNDDSRIECSSACEVRVKQQLSSGARSYIGPAGSSGLQMSAVQVFVEGTDGGAGGPNATPQAAVIGQNAELKAYIFAPNGTLLLRASSSSVGKFVARDVDVGIGADVQDGTGIVVLPDSWVTGPLWPEPALTALNSVEMTAGAQITGDVSVITAAAGPTLAAGFEAAVGMNATVTGNVSGDTVIVRSGGQVTGKVSYNGLTNNGTISGGQVTPLALPLPITVPTFPAFSAGTQAVTLAARADQTLAAGSYGAITLNAGTSADKTVLTLSGGIYAMSDLSIGDNARIECSAVCELRVKNRIAPGATSFLGPAAGSNLDLSDVRVMVEGKNGGAGGPSATPFAAVFGMSSTVQAFVFVPNGTLQLRANAIATGRFVAHDLEIGDSVSVTRGGTTIIAPSIRAQPTDQTVLEGQPATFSLVAEGTDISFQWQREGVNIAGATSGSYTLPNASLADSGVHFRCVVSNTVGSVTSNAALLTVNPGPPVITTQPVSVTVVEGQPATFTCAASGSTLTYKWQKDGADLSGTNSPSFTISHVSIGDAGQYRCVASNSLGSATSNPATLTVSVLAPAITAQPTDQRVDEGGIATFSVTATGTNRQYQWRKNGQDIAGATASTYTTSAATLADDGSAYSVVVSDAGGSVTSTNAILHVNLVAPTIIGQPDDQTVTEGQSTTFTVVATGTNRVYQWRRNGQDITGATASSYTTPPATFADDGTQFSVQVANAAGAVVSDPAVLTVRLLPPVITTQPTNRTVNEGQPASFSVVASGTNPAYQWTRNSTPIAGANGATYTTPPTSIADDGTQFAVIVSNSGGAVTSSAATLSVRLLAPTIVSQPVDQTATEGQTATFSVSATGTNRTYQWRRDGQTIPGANAGSYTTPPVAFGDDGAQYSVVVSNAGGSVTSNAATLSVRLIAPAITSQPSDQTVAEGQSGTFTVVATGTNRSYQWRRGGQSISGATGPSYTTPAATLADDGATFSVVVSNSAGSVTSQSAALRVNQLAPVITSQPTSQTVLEGQTATFSVTATGTGLGYQWRKNGQPIASATNPSYTTAAVTFADDGAEFTVTVTNGAGSVTSGAATLSVQLLPPAITTQPSDQSVTEGQSATFSVSVTGSNLGYQWRRNGQAIASATSGTFTTPPTTFADDGSKYSVVVSNSGGSVTSAPATLHVLLVAPAILSQPTNQSVTEGQSATFTVSATGTNRTFQWRKDGQNISGATNASYTTPPVTDQDDGSKYSVVVTNSGGSVTSADATLTVILLAPAITAQPTDQTAVEGQSAMFTVLSNGSQRVYQWRKNGVDIAGANAAIYVTPPVEAADDGAQFMVAVTNSGGSVTSSVATLHVTLAPPMIATQPTDQTATEGQSALFSVTAAGTAIGYQWRKNGKDIAGAVAASYTTPPVAFADDGAQFSVVISNSGGSVQSNAAALSVHLLAPTITAQPVPQSAAEGQTATFAVIATGTNRSYQWLRNAQNIAGATQSSYTTPALTTAEDGALYSVIVSNSGGSVTSNAVRLSVTALAPTISADPADTSVLEGESASFNVLASGTNLTYQWRKNGQDIAGATAASYATPGVTFADNGAQFSVVVTTTGGSLTSRAATLTVLLRAPVILTQPSSVSVTEGQSASFSVVAAGTQLGYRWQRNGQDIPGATSASYTLSAVVANDDGAQFAVVVSNTGGSATSQMATLHVALLAPTIQVEPADQFALEGQTATFNVDATGTQLSYQWRKNNQNIAGATQSSYTTPPLAVADDGSHYSVVISNPSGSVTSRAALLTVRLIPPVFTQQPTDQSVAEGASATFSAAALGTAVQYQWRKNGSNIAGATNYNYVTPATAATDEGTVYTVVASNSGGSVESNSATLHVLLTPPVITLHPIDRSVTEGQSTTFTCAASGSHLSYRWQKNSQDITGATSPSYTIAAVQYQDVGSYRCIASNTGGSATSQSATLTVLLLPPTIVTQPQNVSVSTGQSFTFSVVAKGSLLSYRWQRFGAPVSGATNASYTKDQADTSDDGAVYRVVVSNSAGSVTSDPATVSVADNSAPTLSTNGPSNVTVTGNSITISGTANDAGSGVKQVVVESNRFSGQDFGAILDSSGSFTDDVPLVLGTNVLTVIARDAHGNQTEQTITVVVEATAAPQLEITEPSNGQVVQTDRVDVTGVVRSSLPAEQIRLTLGSDVLYPSGTGPEYAFTFSTVLLVSGPNLLTVSAETPAGNASAAVSVVLGQETPPPAAVPPQIALQVSAPDVYIAGDAIPIAGTVTAERCVQSVKVNGVAAHVTGSGSVVSFDASLSFAALGLEDVVVQVVARDCDGQTASAGYTAHHDDGPPVIALDGVQLAPAVTSVTQTPYRLTGTVTDRSLAGLRANAQSLSALPSSGAGAWSLAVDVPLTRQTDTSVVIEAWDSGGLSSTAEVILRLDTAVALEVVAPTDGANFLVDGSSAAITVTARASGMAGDDVVQASADGQAPIALARSGDVANGTLNFPATDGAHALSVSVVSASGSTLASTSVHLSFTAESSIPLAVIAQEPANDATDVEANTPVVLHFNKPVDPAKVQFTVLETVHGKIYASQPQGADILSQSAVSLVDADLDREPVPGNAVNFPGNTMLAFYPSRDFGYAGQVQVEVTYDGNALYHSRFGIRRLPTLLQGFVADDSMIPLQAIDVSFPEIGRTVTTDAEGSWSLGFNETADKMLPDGRYRAVFNANMKDPRYGTAEGWVIASSGLPVYSGVRVIPLLNNAEPPHFVQSGQSSPALFMQGDLTLDLSQAQLVFGDGLAEGALRAQFAGAAETGFQFMRSAAAPFGYLLNPGGVQVSGQVGIQMRLPKKNGALDYVGALPDRVALVGLDPTTLAVSVVGVARVDKQALTLASEGPVQLQRLDFIGVSLAPADPDLLQRYGAGNLDLNQLIQSMESK